MAGAEIIWRPLHWLSGACREDLESRTANQSVGGFSMCLPQVAWLGAKRGSLRRTGFQHGSTRLQVWLFRKQSDGCIIFCDRALEATPSHFLCGLLAKAVLCPSRFKGRRVRLYLTIGEWQGHIENRMWEWETLGTPSLGNTICYPGQRKRKVRKCRCSM